MMSFSIFSCLSIEKRECDVPLCTPKCPEYSLTNLRNQNGTAMMVIDITVTNIEIPIGTLDEIEIGLDLIGPEARTTRHTSKIIISFEEFQNDNSAVGTIHDLVLNGKYRPYTIVRSSIDMLNTRTNMTQNIFSSSKMCTGTV